MTILIPPQAGTSSDSGIRITASRRIPMGLVAVAHPKDLEEFYASPWIQEGDALLPPPCSSKVVVVDLREDKTVPALFALWLAGQKKDEGAA